MDEPKRKRTEITIETISVTTIRSRRQSQTYYCETCGEVVVPTAASDQIIQINGQPALLPAAQAADRASSEKKGKNE